jgi:hypothetical protein
VYEEWALVGSGIDAYAAFSICVILYFLLVLRNSSIWGFWAPGFLMGRERGIPYLKQEDDTIMSSAFKDL